MTKSNGRNIKIERVEKQEIKDERKEDQGTLLQMGETLQTAIVSILDGTSTIFRSVLGTFKDSAIFAIRSTKEVSDEFGSSLKSSTLNTIDGSREVSVKVVGTFGKTLIDLSQCAYDTGAKVGNITKTAALSAIRGSSEVVEELFGKIKSGVGSVIPIDRLRFGRKKIVNSSIEDLENN